MARALVYACVSAVALSIPASAAAPVAITSGNGALYWDGSLTSVTLSSPDSQFVTEPFAGANDGFSGGATVDLSTTIPVMNGGNHPLAETYRGQMFQAWVSGSLQIVAVPFVAPHAAAGADGTFQSFTTTFTMTGTITAYATSDRSGTPLFSTTVTGSGIITAGPYRIVGDSYVQQSGELIAFSSPSSPPCTSWTSADVGAVGLQGSSLTCASAFTVSGSGADIWGNADAFQFLYQPIAADGDLVAELPSPVQNTALSGTSTFAKAGLMIRSSLDPSAPQVILDVRPGGGIEFMDRSVAGGPTTFIAGGSSAFPVWLKLSRRGGSVTGYTSADGTTWTAVGSTDAPIGDALVGFAVTSHDTSAEDVATFANVGLWRLPPGWSQTDVGAVGVAGSATATGGVFTVSGAGADIWGAADAFDAVTQPLTGNATLIARVVDEESSQMFAKAGLTIGSLAPDAARVILDTRPDGNIEFMARLADGGTMSFISGATTGFPVWLKLVRAGDQFTGSISSDGSGWTTVGSVPVTMAATLPGGLAVTSHDATMLNTSTFDSVSIVAAPAPSSPADVVVYASDIPATARHGSWTASSESTAAAGVKLVTADLGVSCTDAPLAAPTDYVDVTFNAQANTPYRLWLRLQALNNSKYNDSLWVQFSDATVSGSALYPINSTSGLLVNLATDSSGASLSGWGWQDTAYWLTETTTVTFATSGTHTMRIQVREDGVEFDQVVMSPGRYLNSPPGPVSNDRTIVPKS